MVWGILGKIIKSNARFCLMDRLEVHLDHVMMPPGNCREMSNRRNSDVISVLKTCIVVVKRPFCVGS